MAPLLKQLLKKADLFGVPITLFYKKKENYKSVLGGLCSIFLVCSMVWYTT